MPPSMPAPPERKSVTGNFDDLLAEAGVHIAIDRQSSAEDQATDPCVRFSPRLNTKLEGA